MKLHTNQDLMFTVDFPASSKPVKGRYVGTSKYISVDGPEGVIGLFHKSRLS